MKDSLNMVRFQTRTLGPTSVEGSLSRTVAERIDRIRVTDAIARSCDNEEHTSGGTSRP